MQINRKFSRNAFLAAVALFVCSAPAQIHAEPPHYAPYAHDKTGYWDEHHHHHAYTVRNHHHGYWDERGGTRIWINID